MVGCWQNRARSWASCSRFCAFQRSSRLGFSERKREFCWAKRSHRHASGGCRIDERRCSSVVRQSRTAPDLFLRSGRSFRDQARPHSRHWLDARTAHALCGRGRQIALINAYEIAWRGMASDMTHGRAAPTLSIVVPTYQESKNVPILFERIAAALGGVPWEMIVVDDDFPDGTSNVAFGLAATDTRLRCLRRVNRSGLAGAVIEGWMSSSADFVAVIDGDLQHDESILPAMYQALAKGSGNLVIGTRLRDASEGTSFPGTAEAERSRGVVLQARCRSGGVRPDERLLHDFGERSSLVLLHACRPTVSRFWST